MSNENTPLVSVVSPDLDDPILIEGRKIFDSMMQEVREKPFHWLSFERFGVPFSFLWATMASVLGGSFAPANIPPPILAAPAAAAVFVTLGEIIRVAFVNPKNVNNLQEAIDAHLEQAEDALAKFKQEHPAEYDSLVKEYEAKVKQPFNVKGFFYFLAAAMLGFGSLGMTLPGLWDNMDSIFRQAKTGLEYFTYYAFAIINNTAVGTALAQGARFAGIPGHVANYLTAMNIGGMNLGLVMDEVGKAIAQSQALAGWLKTGLTTATAGVVSAVGALAGGVLCKKFGFFQCKEPDYLLPRTAPSAAFNRL